MTNKALSLSKADARRLLTRYHFGPTDVPGVFERLGSVQYDPLKPVGCNHDLVLQARVPGYRVGDWERVAYSDRLVYDAWDKQASLVRMRDWPLRRVYHSWHAGWWRERVLDAHPEAVEAVLAELGERGPLASTDFAHQVYKPEWRGSWYGPRLTKHVLRALWHTGRVVTHHRRGGKHVYDLSERVVPPWLHRADEVAERESVTWLVLLRHQGVGLLRPGVGRDIWSMEASVATRKDIVAELVREGGLVPVEVEGKLFHAPPQALRALALEPLAPAVRFLAPLDQLLWDRQAARHLFGFDYVWEVYKPEGQRRWGYYVLPVMYGDDFVARLDSRLTAGVWTVHRWWWEPEAEVNADLLEAVTEAARRFLRYLGAGGVAVAEALEPKVRRALERAAP